MVSDGNGFPAASSVTKLELEALEGIDGNIQDQIDDINSGSNDGLPDQSGNAGKFLSTDGAAASWEDVPEGGASSFEDLDDLETAIVPSINIQTNTDAGITQFRSYSSDATTYGNFKANSTGGEISGDNSTAATSSLLRATADDFTGFISENGAKVIYGHDYSAGEEALEKNYSHHNFVSLPSNPVVIDSNIVKDQFLITLTNAGGDIEFIGTGLETFNGDLSITLEDNKTYLFVGTISSGYGNYNVFQSGESGGGGALVDTNSYSSPASITAAIAIPADLRARKFIVGSGAVVDPTLGDGAASQELFLFGTSDTNTVELNSATNLLLSGSIVLKLGSMLALQWITGLNKWVEVSRNEI